MLSRCPFDISVGIRAFVIGLSQISSFFSQNTKSLIHERSVIGTKHQYGVLHSRKPV